MAMLFIMIGIHDFVYSCVVFVIIMFDQSSLMDTQEVSYYHIV